MRFHWQDLNYGEPKRYWLHGRAWLPLRSGYHKRFSSLNVEWHIPRGSHWSITFGGGDSGRNLSVCASIPWVLTLYVTLEGAFARQLFAYTSTVGKTAKLAVTSMTGRSDTTSGWARRRHGVEPIRGAAGGGRGRLTFGIYSLAGNGTTAKRSSMGFPWSSRCLKASITAPPRLSGAHGNGRSGSPSLA